MMIYECVFQFKKDNLCPEEIFELKVDLQAYYPLQYEQIREKAYYEAGKVEFPLEYKDFIKVHNFSVKREYIV